MKGSFGEKFSRLGDFLCCLYQRSRVERPYSSAGSFTSSWRLAIRMGLDSDQANSR